MSNLISKFIAGRYRVDEYIGRGGMADVYKVWDTQRSTYLAMKLLHHDLSLDRVFIRRFKREANTLARLQHPNIVRFFSMEQEGRLAFMLLDFILGETLKHRIFDAAAPLPLAEIIEIMQPICGALHFAHSQGFVHCDLKPGNILFSAIGEAMVSDFGIARMTDSATATLIGVGTPAYMAPEQVQGFETTHQTDIYALGILLYEMLTGGERPFIGDHAQITGTTSEKVCWEQIHLTPPKPSRYNPAISPELEAVVMKCLEKQPSKRYSSVLELLNAIIIACGEIDTDISKIPKQSQPAVKYEHPEDFQATKGGKRGRLLPWLLVGLLAIISTILLVFPRESGPGISKVTQTFSDVQTTQTEIQLAISTSETMEQPMITITPTMVPPIDTAIPTTTPAITISETPTLTVTRTATFPPELGIGSTLVSAMDSMVQVYVPKGDFVMGASKSDDIASIDEFPAHSVYLDAFWIDRTEITNAMFMKFVETTGYNTQAERDGWSWDFDGDWHKTKGADWRHPYGPYASFQGLDDHPVLRVSWDDALAYCAWAGRRLPTEAEWEKAARGTDHNLFPWGDTDPNSTLLNYNAHFNGTSPVGSYTSGASPYGAYDMSGNVWEWVADWFSKDYYQYSPASNPKGPLSGEGRGMRGGSWLVESKRVRSSYREWGYQYASYWSTGFRCAMEASP